ncbi:MAG: signal recognition particle-docking protein FtsY [Gammaproteobacteria bacterium]
MFRKIIILGLVLAWSVIVLGSYVRLSDAGLGCPDWPGCYGQAVVGDNKAFRAEARENFPGHIPEIAKALKEMSHRYLAAVLAAVILILAVLSWRVKHCRRAAVTASFMLILLIGLQAALGMWAVRMQTLPVVVTLHLLLGMVTFWVLYWLYLRANPEIAPVAIRAVPANLAAIGMLALFFQIALGGWASTNYAALACVDFPLCNGEWVPRADYRGALNFFQGLVSDAAGRLDADARVAAHWLHRAGGALVSLIILSLAAAGASFGTRPKSMRRAGWWLSLLLIIQISSGVAIIKLALPMWAALAHTAFAALLMLPLIAVSFYSRYGYVKPEAAAEPEALPAEAAPAISLPKEIVVKPEPEPLYLRLRTQLKRTRTNLSGALANLSLGQKEINDDLLEEIEANLIMADLGVDATTKIINHLTESLERHQLNDASALSVALKQELLQILKPCSRPLQIPKQGGTFVILVVGVNGAGKTTTIGKLAKRLQAQGLSVMLAAGDTFRAAAVEQLQTWGERNHIPVVAQHTGADSASVIYDGLQSAKAKGIDVLIADTAGRLHTKSNLMDELKKVKRIMGKLDETAPHEVLLVLDAGTGQNALSQAKLFNDAVSLTGLALTKLDGTAKGGVIFALAQQLGIPIRFIGVGEGIDDLQDFDAEIFVDALFSND